MAISVIADASVSSGTAATVTTLSLPMSGLTGAAAGDLVIISATSERVLNPTLSGISGFSTIGSVADTNATFDVWSKVLTTGDLTATLTATWTAGRRAAMSAIVIRGGGTPVFSPFPSVGVHVAGSTAGPAMTPAVDNSLFMTLFGGSTASSPFVRTYSSSGSGFTNDANNPATNTTASDPYTWISHKQLGTGTASVSQTADIVTPSIVTNSVWTYALGVMIPPAAAPSAPSKVAAATINSGTAATVTSLALSMSTDLAGAAVGDLLIVMAASERTLNPVLTGISAPTLVGSVNDTNATMDVWTKVLTSGDLTATLTATWTSGRRASFSAIVLRNAGTPKFSTFPTVGVHVAGTTSGPAITPDSDYNMLLNLFAGSTAAAPFVRTYSSSGSGFSNDVNSPSTNTSASNPYSWISHKALSSGTSGASQTTDKITPSDVTNSVWTYALAISVPPGTSGAPVPVVTAGADLIVEGNNRVDLSVTAPGATSVLWTQTSGTGVTLNDATITNPFFISPSTLAEQDVIFSVVGTNAAGSSAPDTQKATVKPQVEWLMKTDSSAFIPTETDLL